jgi:hypothetical protein
MENTSKVADIATTRADRLVAQVAWLEKVMPSLKEGSLNTDWEMHHFREILLLLQEDKKIMERMAEKLPYIPWEDEDE